MNFNCRFCLTKAIYIIPFLCFLSINARAEDTIKTDEVQTVVIEPIVVTARAIKEKPLNTPFMVNTISSKTIEKGHYITAEDAVRSQPSADVHNGGNVAYSSLWMRGTGSLSITSLDDNSVDFRVDGISNGKTGLARNLIDVQQVEIAKGPQGTILGSKAEAGSINIKTTDPQDYFNGKVGIGVGNQNQKGAEAILNMPLSDNVAIRIAAMTDKKDNYLLKKEDNKPLNEQEKQGVQAKIRWHDDDNKNSVIFGIYHDQQTNNVPVLQQNFNSYKVATFNLPHDSKNTAQGATLALKNDVHFADLEYYAGYHQYKGDIQRPYLPPEMLPLQYSLLRIPPAYQSVLNTALASEDNNRQRVTDNVKKWSQELRLVSKPDNPIKWVTGAYIEQKNRDWHNDGKVSLANLPNSPIKSYLTATPSNGDSYKNFDIHSKAIFGEVSYPLNPKLDIIAGARVTNEKLEHTSTWVGNKNNLLATAVKSDNKTLDETATTGRLGLSYAISPQWRLYALQSRGHKFGGFADYETNVAYGRPVSYYKPTKIDASEVGTKFQSVDKKLNVDFAIYQNTMKDDHITVTGIPPVYESSTANVDTRSRGVDLTASWRMNENWQLNADLAYIDAKVTDASHIPTPQAGQTQLTATGNRVPQIPKFSSSIGIGYTNDFPLLKNAQWNANLNYRYVGSRFAQPDNVMELDAYNLLNASVGISNINHEISLWGKNLTDKKYLYLGVQPGSVGTLAPGRTYGVKYSYHF